MFFLAETLRTLRRNTLPLLAAAVAVAVTATVVGVFIPVVQAATGKTNEVRNRIHLEAELKDGTGKAKAKRLGARVEQIPGVSAVEYRTKAQNLRELRGRLHDRSIADLLPTNPLPATLRIRLSDPALVSDVAATLKDRKGKFSPTVTKVLNRNRTSSKILSATSTVKWVLGILAAVLALGSILLVANTIRLSIFSRRGEVEVMRLVGATNSFIRWPFMIEGLLVALMGWAAAVGLLYAANRYLVEPLADRFALVAAPGTVDFAVLAAGVLAAALAVSTLGSAFTLRRYLRV